jgi:pilus assembly protein Flp/PilA
MKKIIRRYVKNESGASLVEYALLCALVAIAAIVGMRTLGTGINTAFNSIAASVTANTGPNAR